MQGYTLMNQEWENKYKELIWVHGHLYKVNESRNGLVSLKNGTDDHFNSLQELTYGYYGMYNAKTQHFCPNDWDVEFEKNLGWNGVYFPRKMMERMGFLTPFEVDAYNREAEHIASGYRLIDTAFAARLEGTKSSIVVDGQLYIMDLDKLEISNVAAPGFCFRFPATALRSGTAMLYDFEQKTPVPVIPGLTSYPQNVACLEFTPLAKVDMLKYYRDAPQGFHWNDVLLHPDPPGVKIKPLTSGLLDNIKRTSAELGGMDSKLKKHRGRSL